MAESSEQFFERALINDCRIVSSGDLTTHQISEAQSKGNIWISRDGFGWVLLPWSLTTQKDRNREGDYLRSLIGKNASLHNENE